MDRMSGMMPGTPRGAIRAFSVLTLALLPAFAGGASAQSGHDVAVPPESVKVTLPEVTVTALRTREDVRRIPAASFVIARDRTKDAAMSRISSLIQNLPGIYAYQEGPSGDPSTVDPRGFTANGLSSYLKVLLDGQDTRDVENGNVDWDWLVPEDVQRVELVQGPGAWVYGDGSEGGILNIVRPEPSEGTSVRASARGGSFGLASGNLGFGWAQASTSIGLEGGHREVDGWRDRSREVVSSAAVRLASRPAERRRWTANVSWLDAEREDPGYLTPDQMAADRTQAENPADFKNTRRVLVGLGFSAGDEPHGELTISPYFRDEHGDQAQTQFFETRYHPTHGGAAGLDAGWRRSLAVDGRPLVVNFGGTLEHATLDSDYRDGATIDGALITSADADRKSSSIYAGARLDMSGTVSVRAGARGDWIQLEANDHLNGGELAPNRTLSAFSPYAAISRVLNTHMSTYVSFSQAFHAPTLDQMYGQRPFSNPFPPFIPPFFTISNAGLDPQRATSFEAGARWDGVGGEYAMITAYTTSVKDEIDFDLATFRYDNLDKTRHNGVLGAGSLRFGRGFSGFASATWQPTTIDGGTLDGNQINAVPQALAAGRLAWTANAWLGFDGGVRWTGLQWLDKQNDHPLADYTTLDLGGSAKWSRLRANVRVGNLADRKIVETGFIGAVGEERLYPAAGRHVTVAIKYE
jgi:outer membrane receptor protein involved in Fe transport